ncbi:hypothetical protein LINPERHAP2_LOCUS44285 [Linum perenne]
MNRLFVQFSSSSRRLLLIRR